MKKIKKEKRKIPSVEARDLIFNATIFAYKLWIYLGTKYDACMYVYGRGVRLEFRGTERFSLVVPRKLVYPTKRTWVRNGAGKKID